MKKRECPHMSECKQFILEHDFTWKCLGKHSWNHANCFKSNTLGVTEMRRLPIEWWGIKLIDRYRELKKNETT